MHHDYNDIRKRIPEPPKWYDENGVPRYGTFTPDEVPDIYATQVVYLCIACQSCAERFNVAMSFREFRWNGKDMVPGHIVPKEAHYGDPPRHDCRGAGETMNCDDLAVLQSWRKGDRCDWVRHSEEEGFIE